MKKGMSKKHGKKTDRLAGRGDAPEIETDCRFQFRERRPFPARRAGFSSHIFLRFFLSCVVPALFAAARALASPRLLLGPGSAALTILTLTFSTVCPLTFPLRFLEGQPGARHGRCRARVHHGCFFGRGASPQEYLT